MCMEVRNYRASNGITSIPYIGIYMQIGNDALELIVLNVVIKEPSMMRDPGLKR